MTAYAQELRRGTAVLLCLVNLEVPEYGYALLASLNKAGVEMDAGTLYPMLRRLEDQGLLEAEWNTDGPRPRKFFHTSPEGKLLAQELHREWQQLIATVEENMKGIKP